MRRGKDAAWQGGYASWGGVLRAHESQPLLHMAAASVAQAVGGPLHMGAAHLAQLERRRAHEQQQLAPGRAQLRREARDAPAEVLVVGARERAVVVEDDSVADHLAEPPVPHPVLRQEDVLCRVEEGGEVVLEARRHHAGAAEDPVERAGVHAQSLLPEEERDCAAAA